MKIIKMRPSHRPVIYSVCSVFGPEKVIECGCGPNSTPIWSKICKEVVGIEHNQEWVDEIKASVDSNVRFIVKSLGKLTFNIYPELLTAEQREDIISFYDEVAEQTDVLYVDSFASTRVYSLMSLSPFAGIVMYHDTEYHKYWYRYFENKLPKYMQEGFKHFSYRPMIHNYQGNPEAIPEQFRGITRQEPSTDIIFRPEHYDRIDQFKEKLAEEHEKYYWKDAPYDLVEVV